jgi:hypothetical protein
MLRRMTRNHMTAPGVVRQVAVPPAVRALSTLGRVDYADAFLVPVPSAGARTAEGWVRAILQDAPLAVRTSLLSGWAALGLKPTRRDDAVLGWAVLRSTPDVALLEAESHLGLRGQLLLRREGDALLFSTVVQHDNPLARGVWAGVEAAHVRIVRGVLEQAAARWRAP